ncbi:hypothetical protein Nepgr_025264 [Nepenthes gracilis]|uniref:Uncharacterized protein n=1 Tax=Nepenthes gracilis TaxID=150966 RepID=A0AAD3T7H6_NEPGR|nr:hypothetical protein Nepgr_025264 [Nepenthes gracilis]
MSQRQYVVGRDLNCWEFAPTLGFSSPWPSQHGSIRLLLHNAMLCSPQCPTFRDPQEPCSPPNVGRNSNAIALLQREGLSSTRLRSSLLVP